MEKIILFFSFLKLKIKENKRQSFAMIAALLVIFKVQYDSTESFGYFGIADTKEINFSSSEAVMIRKIHVIPGQRVTKGMLLIELDRPDIELNIHELKSEMEELIGENKFNKEMNRKLKSIKVSEIEDGENPVEMKIKHLREQIKIWEKEKDDLYIFAQEDGIIGSVDVKVGEKISPFTPFMTMHKSSPSMVKGYIHEQIYNKTFENQKVIVGSIADSTKKVEGVVASVGSRIILFPERLQKSDKVLTWGREVIIMVPENNPFLVGEKVFIESTDAEVSFLSVNASEMKTTEKRSVIHEISTSPLIDYKETEPSGLIYLEDINKYVVISDDTGKKDPPTLFFMNEKGLIEDQANISGIDEMGDMESINVDEKGNIYILSSQSYKKDGEFSDKRKLFVMVKRERMKFRVVKEMNFYEKLNSAAKSNPDAQWVWAITKTPKLDLNIDIEGFAIRGSDAYIGFRNNLKENTVTILKLTNFKNLFDGEKLENLISLHAEIVLPKDNQFKNEGISDLQIMNDKMFILTVNNKGPEGGRIFVTSLKAPQEKIVELKRFDQLKPEGLTYNGRSREFVVSFDQGSGETSKVMIATHL